MFTLRIQNGSAAYVHPEEASRRAAEAEAARQAQVRCFCQPFSSVEGDPRDDGLKTCCGLTPRPHPVDQAQKAQTNEVEMFRKQQQYAAQQLHDRQMQLEKEKKMQLQTMKQQQQYTTAQVRSAGGVASGCNCSHRDLTAVVQSVTWVGPSAPATAQVCQGNVLCGRYPCHGFDQVRAACCHEALRCDTR
eukprot:SAG25_NODE_462_length_7803_cov_21.430945_6_plen_190_part_00